VKVLAIFVVLFSTASIAVAQQSIDTAPTEKKSPLSVRKVDPPTPDRGPLQATPGASGVPMGQPNTAPSESGALISISRNRHTNWGAMILAGAEFRGERDVNANYAGLTYLNLAAGVRYRQWNFLIESDTFSQTSGNATLSVEKKVQDILGWAYRVSDQSWHRISPMMGAGIGAYQIKVETTLSGTETDDSSTWKIMGGASAGLKLDLPVLWVSIEARLLVGDEFDPQPTLSGLARLGLWF
jgi:hypothetical protein